jgi:hypothetical protein
MLPTMMREMNDNTDHKKPKSHQELTPKAKKTKTNMEAMQWYKETLKTNLKNYKISSNHRQ